MNAYCFACNRPTDHFAEHDDLVEAGLVRYDTETGSVYRTEAWDDARVAEVVRLADEKWEAEMAEREVRDFAEQFPTRHVLDALGHCESGLLRWADVAELLRRSLGAALAEVRAG